MSADGLKILVGDMGGRLYVGTLAKSSTATTDANGGASVGNNSIDATVSGFDPNLPVEIKEGDNGSQQLTIGETSSPRFAATISGASAGTTITASTDSETEQDAIEIALPSGRKIKVILVQFPEGSNVGLNLGSEQILSSVTNASGLALNVDIQAVDNGGDITFTVTYLAPASNAQGKIIWTAPGGSVNITATGLTAGQMVTVALSYTGIDLGTAAATSLRLMAVDAGGTMTPAGTNDVGEAVSTNVLGDYGVDTTAKKVWAVVDTLGTYAVGVPETQLDGETQIQTITTYGCNAMGLALIALMTFSFIGLGKMSK
jgi:hypothetical protein